MNLMNDNKDGTKFDIYGNVKTVLADLEKVITDDRSKTHGDPTLFAIVFSQLLNAYIEAVKHNHPALRPCDSFSIMELMKIARFCVSPDMDPPFDTSLDGAGYAVLRAAHYDRTEAPQTVTNDAMAEAIAGIPGPGALGPRVPRHDPTGPMDNYCPRCGAAWATGCKQPPEGHDCHGCWRDTLPVP
jgi:hypothetical protein